MLRRSLLIATSVLAFACSKKKEEAAAPPAGSGSAMAGSGSAMAGSGSAMAGSGSDMGSAGSASGSGSDAGSAGSASGSGSDAGSAAAGSGSGAFDFTKLSHDDQVQFMKTKVMPVMRVEFQKFDPKDFASFTCKTCHGKDPAKSKYKMPTPDLPVLDFAKIKAGKVDPKALEFMSKVVKPKMAAILQLPEMTETQKGFGCLNCHTAKQ